MENTIYRKLHLIMTDIGSLDKDATNTMQHYDYLSEANVKSAVQPLLVKHGVLFWAEVLSVADKELYVTKGGNMTYRTDVDVRYHFVDIDNGSELVGMFKGTGADTSDKGLYKAITGAIKYIHTSTFLIPTEDDPENEQKQAPRTPYNKPKAQNVSSTVSGVENTSVPAKQKESTGEFNTPRYAETAAGKSAVKAYFGYASQLAIPQEKAKNDVKTKYGLKSFMDISKEQLTAENTRMKKLTSDNQKIDVDEISKAIPNAEFDNYLEGK